ncbi:hypothetical protein [Escherichia coli]
MLVKKHSIIALDPKQELGKSLARSENKY